MTSKIGQPNPKFVIDTTSTRRAATTITVLSSSAPEEDMATSRTNHHSNNVIRNRSRPTSTPSSIFHTPKPHNLFSSGFVHFCVVRAKPNPSLVHQNPVYSFNFQIIGGESEKILMVAQKQGNSIRIFDTTILEYTNNGSSSLKNLNKKSGNYIGKLRRDKKDGYAFSLFDSKEDRQELAAFVFSSLPFLQQLKDGIPPRKLDMAIPHVDKDGAMERLPPYLNNRMIESIKRNVSTGMLNFSSKYPSFDRGQYRLNFNGRVTVASVKNIQVIGQKEIKPQQQEAKHHHHDERVTVTADGGGGGGEEDGEQQEEEMFAQFGKVGEFNYDTTYHKIRSKSIYPKFHSCIKNLTLSSCLNSNHQEMTDFTWTTNILSMLFKHLHWHSVRWSFKVSSPLEVNIRHHQSQFKLSHYGYMECFQGVMKCPLVFMIFL
jgi:hypothetical protein